MNIKESATGDSKQLILTFYELGTKDPEDITGHTIDFHVWAQDDTLNGEITLEVGLGVTILDQTTNPGQAQVDIAHSDYPAGWLDITKVENLFFETQKISPSGFISTPLEMSGTWQILPQRITRSTP